MTVEIGSVYRRSPSIPLGIEDKSTPLTKKDSSEKPENVGQPDYSALITLAKEKTYSPLPIIHLANRPLAPMEPEPLMSTAMEWAEYVLRRNIASAYAAENDLRGTF